jgi:hypothetical protein
MNDELQTLSLTHHPSLITHHYFLVFFIFLVFVETFFFDDV